jgi:uncharacterized membrane protein YdjX (TVP38/TMEM64 family)
MSQRNSNETNESVLDSLNLSKKQLLQYSLNILSVLIFLLGIYIVYLGFREEIFTSEEALRNFLEYVGPIAPYAFIFIQIIQVIIPVIPSTITIPLGAMIFGMGQGFLLNYIGIVIGSVVNFTLTRQFGWSLVETFVSEKNIKRYRGWLKENNRFKRLFTFMIFFPLSPDDVFCYLAGLSTITFKRFFLTLIAGKPLTILIYSYGMTALFNYLFQLIG